MRANKKKSAHIVNKQSSGVDNMARWIAEQIKSFGDMAKGFAKNPIGIIALFIVLVYSFAAMLTFSGSLTPTEKTPLVYFLVIFPVIVLGVFAWLVGKHSVRLFAPSDFQNEENFMKIASSLVAANANQQNATETKAVAHQVDEVIVEQTVIEASSKALSLHEPQPPSDLFTQMLDAIVSSDLEGAERVFTRMQESEDEPTQRLRNQSFYLFMRYDLGSDSSALPRLLDLAKREDTAPYAHQWIGRCYEKVGDFEKAATAYEASAHFRETEEERVDEIIGAARCIFKAGYKGKAYDRLMNELGVIESPDAASKLYEGLASLYQLDDDSEFRAIALEKALERRPNDVSLHFDAAFSYGDKNLDTLSILHYKTLLRFKSNHTGALNNVAIEYERLNMPLYSVNCYKKSSELNETLSMANLAYRFMNAGFAEEAAMLLDKARQQKDLNPNVGSAISALSRKEEEEKKVEERILSSAQSQQRFLILFAEAYFTSQPNCPRFEGAWKLPREIEVNIAETADQLEAIGTGNNEEYRFRGKFKNRGAKITFERKTKGVSLASILNPPSLLSSDFTVNKSVGYAYLSLDGQQICIMSLENNRPTFETLSKVQ